MSDDTIAGVTDLGEYVWPEVAGGLVAVPVGSLEQHGPHLPLDTDTRIASAVAAHVPGGVLAPPISYGASGEHEGFPGTVSIGSDLLEQMLVEYGRSVCRWADRVVFVNGHGGNGRALVAAARLLRYEGRDAAWFPCAVPGADAHAGRTETSMLLHLAPEVVRTKEIRPGVVDPIADLMPRLRTGGLIAVTDSGVLGDPTVATAEDGRRHFDTLVTTFRDCVAAWSPDDNAMLRSTTGL